MKDVRVRKSRWTFSLRTLLVLLTLACVILGTWVRRTEIQKRTVAAIIRQGGEVHYSDEIGIQMGGLVWLPPSPRWHHCLIGRDYYASPIAVQFSARRGQQPVPTSVVESISELRSLERIYFFRESPLSDSDIAQLCCLRRLDWLGLTTSEATESGVKSLANRFPRAKIFWRRTADRNDWISFNTDPPSYAEE